MSCELPCDVMMFTEPVCYKTVEQVLGMETGWIGCAESVSFKGKFERGRSDCLANDIREP